MPRPPRGSLRRRLTPPRLLAGSFLLLVALGTLGLKTLPGLYVGQPLSWLDALFTATSAVCITGLIVVDTATYFTRAGQAYLLVLIQLGGLGILTLTTLVILGLGRRLSLHHEAVTTSVAQVVPEVDFRQLLRSVVRVTLLLEGVGAILLTLFWLPRFPVGEAIWHGVFQAVSAFCNAGFSTFSDSLAGFQDAPPGLLVIMALIVIGGVGFLTIEELRLGWTGRGSGQPGHLSLHSRLVLTVTALLLAGGWMLYCTLEWTNTLDGMAVSDRLVNGLFMSVTARTAGFNTVDYAETTPGANFLTILLMSIGGSPGSTAGGLKTTTVAVIGLLALARLRGERSATAWTRTVPDETVQRAVGLFTAGFGAVTAAILVYAVMELGPTGARGVEWFLPYMFEAVSAFNTVGLSMGVTGDLSAGGRLVTVVLMFVGRVGPLTFAAAIALDRAPGAGEFRYAEEDVVIG